METSLPQTPHGFVPIIVEFFSSVVELVSSGSLSVDDTDDDDDEDEEDWLKDPSDLFDLRAMVEKIS